MDFHLTAGQQRLQHKCRELAADFASRSAAHDRDASHPIENYERLREEGFLARGSDRRRGGVRRRPPSRAPLVGASRTHAEATQHVDEPIERPPFEEGGVVENCGDRQSEHRENDDAEPEAELNHPPRRRRCERADGTTQGDDH